MSNDSCAKLKELIVYCPLTGLVMNKVQAGKQNPPGSIRGCLTSEGYIQTSIDRKHYQIHNLIWLYMTGDWPKNQIDHIDGVRNNNRWFNLRDVTVRENHQNQIEHREGKLPGIQQVDNSFVARAWFEGQRKYIGCYKTKEEAYTAYCKYLNTVGEKHL